MFRGQRLVRPQIKSLVGTFAVSILVFIGSQISAVIGYVLALSALVMIIIATYMESFWPKQSSKENPIVFSLFWGLMIGAIGPFILTTFIEGGASAVYEIFTSE